MSHPSDSHPSDPPSPIPITTRHGRARDGGFVDVAVDRRGHHCDHLVEISWANRTMEKGVVVSRQAILSVAIVMLGSMVAIGIALGASCRAAGAQEARADSMERSLSAQAETSRATAEAGRAQYQKLFELAIRSDAQLQELSKTTQELKQTTQALVDAIGVDRRRKAQ